MSSSRIDIRLTKEEKQKAQHQANKLGLTISEYLRLIINIDAATGLMDIINQAKDIIKGDK